MYSWYFVVRVRMSLFSLLSVRCFNRVNYLKSQILLSFGFSFIPFAGADLEHVIYLFVKKYKNASLACVIRQFEAFLGRFQSNININIKKSVFKR